MPYFKRYKLFLYEVYIYAEKMGVVLSFANNSSLVPMVPQSSSESGFMEYYLLFSLSL